jgi:hypothetical protein
VSSPNMPTPVAAVLDDQVLSELTVEPQMVIRMAHRLRYDVFDVEGALKRLVTRGLAVWHPSTAGVPVKWSRASR